ncbi:MAG: FeoB-associated Cys-rich membrane protein [Bifidobacteriaceae bacterium]|nr:FeoB-associated Cys-rich membrane protein [Bifidobacteriaceae bacterium]
MSPGTVAVGLALLALVVWIVARMIVRRKRGIRNCAADCACCETESSCPAAKPGSVKAAWTGPVPLDLGGFHRTPADPS